MSTAKYEVKTISRAEEYYTFNQSNQIFVQAGFIGYLRADFGSDGKEFYSTWNEFNDKLKTPEFAVDLDMVINELRQEKNLLQNMDMLRKYCGKHPELNMKIDHESYAIRINTDNYAHILRLKPRPGEYNIYCYCYKKDLLDEHLSKAAKGIRFIDPHYKEKFVIDDGDRILIKHGGKNIGERVCRYIDEYHVEVGTRVFHICEFAERIEENGNTVIPIRNSMPEQCYIYIPEDRNIALLKKGESGYFSTKISNGEPAAMREFVDSMNRKIGLSKAQFEAMKAGAMFGWDTPAADPKNYDDSGRPIKPKKKNRDAER